jgi:hypothetical protein
LYVVFILCQASLFWSHKQLPSGILLVLVIGSHSLLFSRIESISPLEVQGTFGGLQGKEIILVDKDGAEMSFILWGDQIHLANLLAS